MKRWPLYLILVIAIGTPVVSTLFYFYAPPENSTNLGELITPVSLPQGVLPPNQTTEQVWHLLTIADAECDLACQQRLCLIHQIRLVNLGDKDRIGRVWLQTGSNTPPTQLSMEPGCGRNLAAAHKTLDHIDILTEVITAALPANWSTQLPGNGTNAQHFFYIVDPQENIIMRYPESTAAKDIAKDLKRLLRLSRRA